MRKFEVTFQERLKQQQEQRYKRDGHINGKRQYKVIAPRKEPEKPKKAGVFQSLDEFYDIFENRRVDILSGRRVGKSSLTRAWDEIYGYRGEIKWLTPEEAMLLKLQGYEVKEFHDKQ